MKISYSIIDLLEIVSAHFDKLNIDYMITGSIALNIYVDTRSTNDIDIIINLKYEQVDTFLELFSENYYFSKKTIKEEIQRQGMFNIISDTTGYKIDFIIKRDSEYMNCEFERRSRKRVLNKFEAWVISAEDLVISKLMWIQQLESERQKDDISNLLLTQKNMDLDYIKSWIKKLNLNTYNLLK
ncbi:MAG: DUF6036 family nucleotidyltransferase [Bacteroidia bacterium]